MPLGENFNDNYLLAVSALGRGRRASVAVSLITNSIPLKTKTANYTIVATTDSYILADATAGSITITMPSVATAWNGTAGTSKMFTISKKDASANPIVIDGAGASIIGSATQSLLYQYEVINLVTDGTSWYLLN